MRQTTSVLDVVISAVLTAGIPEPCEAGEGRVAVIDGTLAPCWSWAGHRQLYSGKQHTTGHNHRVVRDLGAADGLVTTSDYLQTLSESRRCPSVAL